VLPNGFEAQGEVHPSISWKIGGINDSGDLRLSGLERTKKGPSQEKGRCCSRIKVERRVLRDKGDTGEGGGGRGEKGRGWREGGEEGRGGKRIKRKGVGRRVGGSEIEGGGARVGKRGRCGGGRKERSGGVCVEKKEYAFFHLRGLSGKKVPVCFDAMRYQRNIQKKSQ